MLEMLAAMFTAEKDLNSSSQILMFWTYVLQNAQVVVSEATSLFSLSSSGRVLQGSAVFELSCNAVGSWVVTQTICGE